MNDIVKLDAKISDKLITLRGQQVIIDSDVASLYDVETKRINEAVKNNPDKFPEGYLIELNSDEWDTLKSKFSTSIAVEPRLDAQTCVHETWSSHLNLVSKLLQGKGNLKLLVLPQINYFYWYTVPGYSKFMRCNP
jgi:hypothetical protein